MTPITAYIGFKYYHVNIKDQEKIEVTSKGTPGSPLHPPPPSGNLTMTVFCFFLYIFNCSGSVCRGSHIIHLLLLPKFQQGFMMILYPFDTFITANQPCNYVTHSLICGSSASFGKTFEIESSVSLSR